MKSIIFSKKNLLAILAGFVVIILLRIITNTFSFFLSLNIAASFSPQDFNSAFTQQPYLTYGWLLRIISYLSLILGGFVVGKIVKKNGWICGIILGLIFVLISILGAMLRNKDISPEIFNLSITVALTFLGGYIGETLARKNSKH